MHNLYLGAAILAAACTANWSLAWADSRQGMHLSLLAQAIETAFEYKAPAVGTKLIVFQDSEEGERLVKAVNGKWVTFSGFRTPGNRDQEWSTMGHIFPDKTTIGTRIHIPEEKIIEKIWPAKVGSQIKFDINRNGIWWRDEYSIIKIEKKDTPIGSINTLYIEGSQKNIPAQYGSYHGRMRLWYGIDLGLMVRVETEVLDGLDKGQKYLFEIRQVIPPK